MFHDTIAAISTANGISGIGIIRISGKLTRKISKKILRKVPEIRKAEVLPFYIKNIPIDTGIAIFFSSPHSYTGEDILELQGHGNPVILQEILNYIISFKNTRIANPGEFSERSVLNGKMSVPQAELVSELIYAENSYFAYSIYSSLKGNFLLHINRIEKKIKDIRIFIESRIDFIEGEIDELYYQKLLEKINKVEYILKNFIEKNKKNFSLYKNKNIVVFGPPNVGKSTLFNKIVEKKSSIVTSTPGTTRDIISNRIYIKGIPITISDTAGIRKSKNRIEKLGIKIAIKAVLKSFHAILVLDARKYKFENCIPKEIINRIKKKSITIVRNKSDLSGEKEQEKIIRGYKIITVSAKLEKGLDFLKKRIEKIVIKKKNKIFKKESFFIRERHIHLLKESYFHILECKKIFLENKNCLDILAEEIRISERKILEIQGKKRKEEIMKEIFSKFCVGK